MFTLSTDGSFDYLSYLHILCISHMIVQSLGKNVAVIPVVFFSIKPFMYKFCLHIKYTICYGAEKISCVIIRKCQ